MHVISLLRALIWGLSWKTWAAASLMWPCVFFGWSGQVLAQGAIQPQPILMTYSTNPQYPPYDWANDNAGFQGASIELLEMLQIPGVGFVPRVLPWKRALTEAEAGRVDLLVSLRITPEREKFLTFSSHRAFPNPIAIFVRSDRDFAFENWDALIGKRGGYSAGDTFGGGFDEYWRKSLTMEEAPTMENNFKKLQLGRIDYFVTSYYLGQAYLRTQGTGAEIIALKPFVSNMDIHIGFSKKSPYIYYLDQISRRLEEIDKKGGLEALLQKYLDIYERTMKASPVGTP